MSSAAAGRTQQVGHTVGGAGGPGNNTPDWKWSVVRAVVLYFAMVQVIGPNGLIAKWRGTASLPAAPAEGADTTQSTSTAAPPVGPKGPQLPLARSLWEQNQTLDLYVFLAEGPPPTYYEILTQYSQWTHYGLGPYGHDLQPRIDFAAKEYQPLLAHSGPSSFDSQPILSKPNVKVLPAVKFPHISYSQPKLDLRADFGTFPISDAVRTGNHSIWAEMFLCSSGVSPNPADPSFSPLTVHRQRKLLTRLFARKKRRVERNLFDSSNSTQEELVEQEDDDFDEKNPPIGTHWHRNFTLALVPFGNEEKIDLALEPPPSAQFIFPVMDPAQAQQVAQISTFDSSMRFQLPVLKADKPDEAEKEDLSVARPKKEDRDVAYHYPVLVPLDFWLLRGAMHPINSTVRSLPLHINIYTTSPWKFKIQSNMNEGWEKAQNGQATGLGAQAGSAEIDMLKSILLETSPWWLILTAVVSLLHSLFEILAFSSDIGDWRKRQDLAGISIGSILTNVVTQVIILLYLIDSNEETSFMIIMGQGVGAAIEAWKLTKAVKVAVVPTPANASGILSILPYQVRILNKRVLSEEEKKTQEYDRLAFKIVGMVAAPVLGMYAIYSALYNSHRGWWSFVIQTLTSFVYTFGFVSLVPQLILNYKLKSTAGFSPKTLVYKILGTVVDDFFAFAIPQPMLHRLACFRDDIVFLIFLYQRWLYGVDPTRQNELGEIVDKEGAKRKELAAAAASEGDKKAVTAKKDGTVEDEVIGNASSTGVEKNTSSAKSRKQGK
ncbi:hypothetical protein CF327_g5833 [Tilletia walkeri]|uniref:Cleft lip and palate transmembrane protein 1 n=1 Tax=Tilletia walkeri TaxID=117179 RepID=A0A8X7N8V7_9BASI|nr:hypothetical protein CF327_g5833 [Tilletia walkeri]KAE8267765.1 hypothetical protein A4X09_0g4573 [Tilletia walkeri]